ncbi:MAG: hypothetical protein U9R12_03845 [Candidatus Caldatribacteriota bacterium]|nr:hypothetical protein [Candidatus Caldatribacteriota bacterium]
MLSGCYRNAVRIIPETVSGCYRNMQLVSESVLLWDKIKISINRMKHGKLRIFLY